jgi:hypothetical protein
MHYFNKLSIVKIQNQANKWITKNWSLIHIIFLIFYSLYILSKAFKFGKILSNNNTELISPFKLLWFIIDTIGFILLAIVFISGIKFKLWQYIGIIFIGFILIKIAYVNTMDTNLNWPGSDTAIGNYISAEEVVKFGALDLLKTWNERTNPNSFKEINNDLKDSIIYFINKYNLSCLAFDKWKTGLDSSSYDLISNNRPFMHPPLTPILMGFCLKVFPFGRWSLEYMMWFITFLSILLVILYSYKKSPGNLSNIALISFTTSLVMFRFHSPSADQFSMFLFTLPIIIFIIKPSNKFWLSFLFGVIYGLCFYTKFNVMFFISILVISLLLYSKKITLKPFFGIIFGFLVPIIIFTSLGYYFWLTLITSHVMTKLYATHNPANLIENTSKLLYFGPSFLLLFLLLLINSNKLEKKLFPYYIPALISLFVLTLYLYQFGDLNRYLIQYMPIVLLFILSMDNIIELRKRDLFISLFTNFIFLHLNIYF